VHAVEDLAAHPERLGEADRDAGSLRVGLGHVERLSEDVFRLPEVADEGQRVAEGHVLEAPGELAEGVEIAPGRGPNR